jgi:hypothetical protein
VHAERANFPISFMATELGVSRQGYAKWVARQANPPGLRAVSNAVLLDEIRRIFLAKRCRSAPPTVIPASHSYDSTASSPTRRRLLIRYQSQPARAGERDPPYEPATGIPSNTQVSTTLITSSRNESTSPNTRFPAKLGKLDQTAPPRQVATRNG